MKAVKIYALVWFFAVAAAVALYLTGFFSLPVQALFGVIYVTLYALGIMAVLPLWVNEHYSPGCGR